MLPLYPPGWSKLKDPETGHCECVWREQAKGARGKQKGEGCSGEGCKAGGGCRRSSNGRCVCEGDLTQLLRSGRKYYVHPEARVSQWEPPPRPPPPQIPLDIEKGAEDGADACNGVVDAGEGEKVAGGTCVEQEDAARPRTAGGESIERLPSSSRPKTSGLT